ncbi:TPA: hypothetical protein ACH3X1_009885 [Trebouxia sp. C0004]
MISNKQADLKKISSIFESFDIGTDSKLSAQELKALIQQCNPSVIFTDVQLQAIVGEVLEQYEGSADAGGLTRQSLMQLYLDGKGNCDLDFATLQLVDSKVKKDQSMVNTVKLTQQKQIADHAIFADLFDQSPGITSKSSGRNSFSFDLQDASCDENNAPNIGPPMPLQSRLASNCDVTLVAPGSQSFTFHGPGLTSGSWGAPTSLPVPYHAHGDMSATFCAATNESFSKCRMTDSANLMQQEDQSCGALVDELAEAVQQNGGDWQQTAQALRQRADALDSADCYDAHMEMGMLLTARKLHEEAVKSFQHAAAAMPADARPLFRLGNALFAAHQLAQSQEAFSEALEAATLPDDAALLPKIHVNLGISLEAAGQLDSACQHYRDALQMNPKHFRALKLLGSALYAQGDLQGACTALQSALQLNPTYADAYCDLGCALCALGRVEDAKEAFGNAARVNPTHVEALFNLGNLHRQSNACKSAVQCYDAVLALNSQHWRSTLNKAVALMGLHEDRAAQLALKQAYNMSGHDAALLQEVASLSKMAQSSTGMQGLAELLQTVR